MGAGGLGDGRRAVIGAGGLGDGRKGVMGVGWVGRWYERCNGSSGCWYIDCMVWKGRR